MAAEKVKGRTFAQFQKEMIAHATSVLGKKRMGQAMKDYYTQDCWLDQWEDGETPADTVDSDMSYWDS